MELVEEPHQENGDEENEKRCEEDGSDIAEWR